MSFAWLQTQHKHAQSTQFNKIPIRSGDLYYEQRFNSVLITLELLMFLNTKTKDL